MPFPPVPTPIPCPFCRAQIVVPIRQVVDVTEEPQLKSALLSGRLNAFTCPHCHNSGALAAPFLYHDATKELAFVFMPLELGVREADQQRVIGQMTKAVMSRIPAEKRKAYLIQPKQFFTMQSLVEAVLEADGVTKAMLAAQEAKLKLLEQLIQTTDNAGQQALIREHAAEFDMQFFQMLNLTLSSAQADQAEPEFRAMLGLRNNLLEMTEIGHKVKLQEDAIRAFQAKPDRETLLAQLIQASDSETRQVLLTVGRPLLDYPFFQALTARIEAANKAGNKAEADQLIELRKEILALREKLDTATKALFDQRTNLLRELMVSENLDQAIAAHASELDEVFFSILEANMQNAAQAQQQATFDRLQAVAEAINGAMEAAQPPEVRFLNALLSVEYPEGTRKLLEANQRALGPQLLGWMRNVAQDLKQNGREDAAEHLGKVIELAAGMITTTPAAEPAAPAAPSAPQPASSKPSILVPGATPPPQDQPKPQILIAKR